MMQIYFWVSLLLLSISASALDDDDAGELAALDGDDAGELAAAASLQYFSYYGMKGSRGPSGIPGTCPTWCGSNQCEIGARSVLQEAIVDGKVSIAALSAVVDEGNKTAEEIENGMLSIESLSVERANSLYTYLIFKNGICDTALLNGPDIVVGEKGSKGSKGSRGRRGFKGSYGNKGSRGSQGNIGVNGYDGNEGQKGEMGLPGLKGDMGELGPAGNDSDIAGPPGPQGPVGPPGQPGMKGMNGEMGNSGVLYINWGNDTCPAHADTLYAGTIVRTEDPRGVLQCLQDQVILHTLVVPSHHINNLKTMDYTDAFAGTVQPIRCATCYVASRSTKFSYLGGQSCPANWTTEYVGVLSSQHQEGYSDSVCVNEKIMSEIDWGEFAVNDLDLVGAECGSVPCLDGQIPCAICTR